MRRSDPAERVFHSVAAGVVVLAVAWAVTRPAMTPTPKPPPPEPFVVALQAPPPEAPPEPPKPEPKTPPPPPNTPPPPVQKALPPPPPLPTPPLPAVLPQTPPPPPPPQPVQPVQTAPPVAPTPPSPPPAPPSSANAEASYTGKLRAYIRTITEYPTSGDARRTKPEGKVQVRFTLNRGGQLHDVAIEQTSGSSILDKKALSIVKDGTYPAMPKEIWANDAEHVFTVTVEFVAP